MSRTPQPSSVGLDKAVLGPVSRRPLDVGERGIVAVLRSQAAEIATTERHLEAQKKRRDLLVMKLVTSGLTEREIAKAAGISGVRVNQIKGVFYRNDPRRTHRD